MSYETKRKLSSFLISLLLMVGQLVPFLNILTPNFAYADVTGFQSPTAADSSGSLDDWSNRNNAFTSDGLYATESTDNEDQRYTSFGLSVPAGSTINGVEVTLEAFSTTSQTNIWSDGFGTSSSETVNIPDWEEEGSENDATTLITTVNIDDNTESGLVASPDGGRFAKIGQDEWVCRSVPTGYNSLNLDYYWRGDNDAEDGLDFGYVEYSSTGTCDSGATWTTVAAHELDDGSDGGSAWSSEQSVSLPNGTTLIRFRQDSSDAAENFRIDGVSVTGIPNTTSELEVRIDGNGSPSSTNYKPQALTDTETVYTLGGSADLWGKSWTPSSFTDANFRLEVRFDNPNSGEIASLDHVQAKVYYTPPVQPEPNPSLPNSCGLDIALVLDSSGSIDNTELTTMKNAFKAFVDAFLPATPTQFSVTDFDDSASVLQSFSGDATTIKNAIDLPTSGGSTNWEDGLITAQGTFDPRSNPNLIIFASDGNPTESDGPLSDLEDAIVAANAIKTAGIRIVALGIGNELNTANLEAISGSGDVITSDFATLAADLAAFAAESCGGTINVRKFIDQNPVQGWTFTIDGQEYVTGADGFTQPVPVDPGTYSVVETSQVGYGLESASCTIDNQSVGSPITNGVGSVAVDASDIVSCVFINSLQQGHLIVQKTTNPGGDFTEFPITATGSGTITGGGAGTITDAIDKDYTVTPGIYSVVETTPPGWEQIGNTCDQISVENGATVYCTITNGKLPTLTVFKDFIKDDGGNEAVENFGLYIDGTENPSLWGASNILSIGGHNFFELGPDGYAPSFSEGCENGNVDLGYGDDVICTITNDDIAPTITLNKVVSINNGGTAGENGFGLTIGGTPVSSGQTLEVEANTPIAIDEAGLTGYEFVSITGDEDCPAELGGTVTLDEGEDITCTITNEDQPGTLIVQKIVEDEDGGDANGSDFYFQVNGGETGPFLDDEALKEISVPQGVYTVTETEESADGYETSYGEGCEEVFIPSGGSATCTVTNTAIAPTLRLVKEVINNNGGGALPGAWTLFAIAGEDESFNDSGDSTQFHTVIAGRTYTLSESEVPGYSASGWSCGERSLEGAQVTLALGENLTCTITNDDIAPKLTVIKRMVNNGTPPGTKSASDFTLSVTGTNPSPAGFPGNESGVVVTLDAGAYSVTEATVAGYTTTYSDECSGTIGIGEEKTCTVTNNDQDVLAAEDDGGDVLPETGMPLVNLLFAAAAFEVGLYLRRRTRRA
jgi:hypothetical protein